MSKVFEGRTEDAEAPFLSGGFWKDQLQVIGIVEREYGSENGPCFVLELEKPVSIAADDGPVSTVSIGNLSGFNMALQAARATLQKGDLVEIECTGIKPPKAEGYSPRPNFRVKIVRP